MLKAQKKSEKMQKHEQLISEKWCVIEKSDILEVNMLKKKTIMQMQLFISYILKLVPSLYVPETIIFCKVFFSI